MVLARAAGAGVHIQNPKAQRIWRKFERVRLVRMLTAQSETRMAHRTWREVGA